MDGSTKEEEIERIFSGISELLGVEIEMRANEGEKLKPHFNLDAIISKFLALMTYCGWNVPSAGILPSYNRVHADVEFWRKKFEVEAAAEPAPSSSEEAEIETETGPGEPNQ